MDFDRARRSMVAIRSRIPEDGFTAGSLGTEREGNGVVIRDNGLVLTIGYLITEAESVWLSAPDGRVIEGHALAYDQESGFGLVQALRALDLPALDFGNAGEAKLGDSVILAGAGEGQASAAKIVGKEEFAGYWEYLLDEALFTAPAQNWWGGAGLVDAAGKLLGVGSLLIQGATETGRTRNMNMVVPIDLLPPILDDLLSFGRVNKPPRPWLGVYSLEGDDKVIVASVAEGGPAEAAGLRRGDVISSVRDESVEGLADFYRKVWSSGAAGAEIPVEVVRDGRSKWRRIKSADRSSYLKKQKLH